MSKENAVDAPVEQPVKVAEEAPYGASREMPTNVPMGRQAK